MKRACYSGLIIGLCAVAGAADLQGPGVAPLNPAFIEFMDRKAGMAARNEAAGEYNLGLVPTPLDLSEAFRHKPVFKTAPKNLPLRYDLRDLGRVTPVRNQSPYGTCWAFASYGSLESCLMPAESRYFSVNNLANRHGFDYGYDDGGGWTMSAAYLARWDGPVDEADDPYSDPGHSPSGLPVQKHVNAVYCISRSGTLDDALLKQAVMDYGAIYIAFYYNDSGYTGATKSYYYSGTNRAQNHAVAMTGWDDAFSRTNFTAQPPGDGAFILKNSWGTNWAESGYFYMSYYEPTFWGGVSFCGTESPTNMDANYQYDPLGWVTSFGYSNNAAWGANIFTATSAVSVSAVGLYTPSANARCQVFLYSGVVPGYPRSGFLQSVQMAELSFAGYHTIALNAPVALSGNTRFSVVVGMNTPNYLWPLPAEMAVAGWSSRATASPGQSYMCFDGTNYWYDVTDYDSSVNFCFKALGCRLTDVPGAAGAVADYDGDGFADPSLCHPVSGAWTIKHSRMSYQSETVSNFSGKADWIPASADYDGDGLGDYGLYNRTTGEWELRLSSAGSALVNLASFAIGSPVPADYDGDGRADPAVYEAATGSWRILLSSAGYAVTLLEQWAGGPAQLAVPADYDGDRKADPALYQAIGSTEEGSNDASWTILLSGSGYASVTLNPYLGGPGWCPVPADYDGDRLADPAVWQARTGTWKVRLSSGGYYELSLPGFLGL